METINKCEAWNKGKLVGQKPDRNRIGVSGILDKSMVGSPGPETQGISRAFA